MKNEEAIEYLKRADTTVGQTIKTRTAEALEMAIKALEQEPILDKIKGYIVRIRNTGMGKKKSLEFIEKFI